jgi:hypothetical protein
LKQLARLLRRDAGEQVPPRERAACRRARWSPARGHLAAR